MDNELCAIYIDRNHRIEKLSPRKKRSIIVNFLRYNILRNVFSNKKNLKDPGISITKSLTAWRMEKFSKARNENGFRTCELKMARLSLRKMELFYD